MPSPPDPAAHPRDELRRRLYRPGSTEADLRRYLDAGGRVPEPEAVPQAARAGRAGRARVPRRALPLAATVLAGAVLAGTVLAGTVLAGTAVSSSPAPVGTPAEPLADRTGVAVRVDVGDGHVLTVGDAPVTGPRRVPSSVGGRPADGRRYRGRGDAVVDLDTAGAGAGGRAMVAVSTTGAAPIVWRALLLVTRRDWTSYPVVLARGTAAGSGSSTTFAYPDQPPSRIAVEAGRDEPWTLLVAVDDGAGARPSVSARP